MSHLEIIFLALAFVGVLPSAYVALLWFSTFLPARQLLAFQSNGTVDVVVTTSAVEKSSVGSPILRATTGIGQIQGLAHVGKAVGRYLRTIELRVAVSNSVNFELENDLVVLGGPAKNNIAKRLLDHFGRNYPDLPIAFDDIGGSVRVGDFEQKVEIGPEPMDNISNDLAIVMLWKNPFAASLKRGIFCAGITSYGTAGASNWFFRRY